MRFGIHAGPQDTTIDELRRLWRFADESGYEWCSSANRHRRRSSSIVVSCGPAWIPKRMRAPYYGSRTLVTIIAASTLMSITHASPGP